MNQTSTTSSAKVRQRLLIVGQCPIRDELQASLDEEIEQVDTLYDAIGALSTKEGQLPIHTVLIWAQTLRPYSGRAIEALHCIDPSIRLLLVETGADESVLRQLGGRFEGKWRGATDADSLASFIRTQDTSEHHTTPTITQNSDTNKKETPQSDSDQSDSATPASLGDVDLVHAIQHKPEQVTPLALSIIKLHTQWTDLSLHDSSAEISDEIHEAAITWNDECFGYLQSRIAPLVQLEAWAQWLAQWLAFDDNFQKHQRWAFTDDLTGAGNRRFFHQFLSDAISRAGEDRRPVTLMVFDIDDFKMYNDRYGHEAGDEILQESVKLMTSGIRQGDRVCRIGGDEFAVIFADPEDPREPGSDHPAEIQQIAQRFQSQIAKMQFPKLGSDAPGSLTISGGLASYPWDGMTPETLLRLADQRALHSKRCGKNAITFGPKAVNERNNDEPGNQT